MDAYKVTVGIRNETDDYISFYRWKPIHGDWHTVAGADIYDPIDDEHELAAGRNRRRAGAARALQRNPNARPRQGWKAKKTTWAWVYGFA